MTFSSSCCFTVCNTYLNSSMLSDLTLTSYFSHTSALFFLLVNVLDEVSYEKQPLWSSAEALKLKQTPWRRHIKVDLGDFWQIHCVWHSCSMLPLLSLEVTLHPKSLLKFFFFKNKHLKPCGLQRCCKKFCYFLFFEEQWLRSASCHLQFQPKWSWLKNESKREI